METIEASSGPREIIDVNVGDKIRKKDGTYFTILSFNAEHGLFSGEELSPDGKMRDKVLSVDELKNEWEQVESVIHSKDGFIDYTDPVRQLANLRARAEEIQGYAGIGEEMFKKHDQILEKTLERIKQLELKQ